MIGNATRSPLALSSAPGPAPTAPDREPQHGAPAHPFAELLRQQRLAEAQPTAAAQASSAPAEARDRADPAQPDESEAPAGTGTPSSQRDAGQARTRSAGGSRATARTTVTPSRSSGAAEAARHKDEDGSGSATAPADPVVTAGTAGGARPEQAQRAGPGTGERGCATGVMAQGTIDAAQGHDAGGAADPAGAVAPGSPTQAAAATGATRAGESILTAAADAGAGRADAEAAGDDRGTPSRSFGEALAESMTQLASTAPSRSEAASPGPAGLPAALAEPTRGVAPGANAAVTTSSVPVPVESPDFAAAFGLQVSTLARDGIQRAELHLNPAEMGPVSIQITLDGMQARVDFGADMAATRHAIEAGLPELASALRDAGFTLAGGGVAQHSPGGGGAGDDDADPKRAGLARAAGAPVARLDAAAQRAARRVSAGGVDLYA